MKHEAVKNSHKPNFDKGDKGEPSSRSWCCSGDLKRVGGQRLIDYQYKSDQSGGGLADSSSLPGEVKPPSAAALNWEFMETGAAGCDKSSGQLHQYECSARWGNLLPEDDHPSQAPARRDRGVNRREESRMLEPGEEGENQHMAKGLALTSCCSVVTLHHKPLQVWWI